MAAAALIQSVHIHFAPPPHSTSRHPHTSEKDTSLKVQDPKSREEELRVERLPLCSSSRAESRRWRNQQHFKCLFPLKRPDYITTNTTKTNTASISRIKVCIKVRLGSDICLAYFGLFKTTLFVSLSYQLKLHALHIHVFTPKHKPKKWQNALPKDIRRPAVASLMLYYHVRI